MTTSAANEGNRGSGRAVERFKALIDTRAPTRPRQWPNPVRPPARFRSSPPCLGDEVTLGDWPTRSIGQSGTPNITKALRKLGGIGKGATAPRVASSEPFPGVARRREMAQTRPVG